jgi:Stress responsive A/B Barrel Domain
VLPYGDGLMIMHVVTFVWAENVTSEEINEVCSALEGLPAKIPALQSYRFGPDAGLRTGNGDFAIVAALTDEAALRAYLDDPAHLEVATRLRAMAERRTAVQVRTSAS